MTSLKLAVIDTGPPPAKLQRKYGVYSDIFFDQIDDPQLSPLKVSAFENEPLPALNEIDAVILTGSPYSVTEPEDWVHRLAEWSRQVVRADKPFLGVCYGHQLLAFAFEGQVDRNHGIYEIGEVSVQLSAEGEADPLLGALPHQEGQLSFHNVHQDAVLKLPQQAVHLAASEYTAHEAYRIGQWAWGVQFHPEFGAEFMRGVFPLRKRFVDQEAERRGVERQEYYQSRLNSSHEEHHGTLLLRRFVELAREKL